MASSVREQLGCSLWRHYLSHVRQWPWLISILVIAVLPFAILAILKSTLPPSHQDTCHFKSRSLSSVSPLSLIQSFVCNLPNDCQKEGQDDQLDAYPGALINGLLNDTSWLGMEENQEGKSVSSLIDLPSSIEVLSEVTTLLTNPALEDLMEKGVQVRDLVRSSDDLGAGLTQDHNLDSNIVSAILESKINISRILSLIGYRDLHGVVCSPDQLSQFLVATDTAAIKNISDILCKLPLDEAANITRTFIDSLDANQLFDKVSEVLEAIGGYEAEKLLQEVKGLLTSLGRLEALAPLAQTFGSIITAIEPLSNALSTLEENGWDMDSISSMVDMLEPLLTLASSSSQVSTAALRGSRPTQLLLSPDNLTALVSQKNAKNPWEELLRTGASAVKDIHTQLANNSEMIKKNPAGHTIMVALTSILPVVLAPGPLEVTRLGESLDKGVSRLLPEVQTPVNQGLTYIFMATDMAINITRATEIMASWVSEEPPSPHVCLTLLNTLTNFSLVEELIIKDELASWMCKKSSWPDLSNEEWLSLEVKMCSEQGQEDLKEISALLKTAIIPTEEMFSTYNASVVLNNIVKLSSVLRSSRNLLQLLEMDVYITEGGGGQDSQTAQTTGRRKRSLINAVDLVIKNIPGWNEGDVQRLNDEISILKYYIRSVTKLYMNLASSALQKVNSQENGIKDGLLPVLRRLAETNSTQAVINVTSSLLDIFVRLTSVTSGTWNISSILQDQKLRDILQTTLPNDVVDVITNIYEFVGSPTHQIPPPFPQLLDFINATYILIMKEGSLRTKYPYTAELLSYVGLVPRLLAIPYLWSFSVPSLDTLLLMNNETEWREYPCGETSLVQFYPASTAVTDLPPTWSDMEDVKGRVRAFEAYLCQNFSHIRDELSSDTQLSESAKALVDDWAPKEVNIGESVQLFQSIVKHLMTMDLQKAISNITTSEGKPLLQELQDTFHYPPSFKGNYTKIGLELANYLLMSLQTDPDPAMIEIANDIRYTMFHLHNVITALSEQLQDKLSLASMIGLPANFPPLLLLEEDPNGTAEFIREELIDALIFLIKEEMPLSLEDWASGMCNRSVSRSSTLQFICYFIFFDEPLTLQSDVTKSVITAVNEFTNPERQIEETKLSKLFEDFKLLTERLKEFDFEKPPDLNGLDHFLNMSARELGTFITGLQNLTQKWPWEVLATMVNKDQEIANIHSKSHEILLWLKERLPNSKDEILSNIPSHIKEFHNLINSTWIDLLDGLHYNLNIDPDVFNQSVSEICTDNSGFTEPPESNGVFLKSLSDLCNFTSIHEEVMKWLNFEELKEIVENKNSSSTYSVFETYQLITEVKNQAQILLEAFMDSQLLSSLSTAPRVRRSTSSTALSLPSYFLVENWEELSKRISSRNSFNNLTSIVEMLEIVNELLGDKGISPANFQLASLQVALMQYVTAKNFEELLKDAPEAQQLMETVMSYAPLALKDAVETLSKQPKVVVDTVKAFQEAPTWEGICNLDLNNLGNSTNLLQKRLCQVNGSQLLEEMKTFLNLNLSQNESLMSVAQLLNSSLTVVTELKNQIEDGSLVEKYRNVKEYFGLQTWMSVPSLVFNVSEEELWENSTMVLATLLEPLVTLSRQQNSGGEMVKNILTNVNKYLRWARLLLSLIKGGDVWKLVRETYVDKPNITQVFDMIEKLPQFFEAYIKFFGNKTIMSQQIFYNADTPCNVHLYLIDGHRELLSSDERMILTDVIEFVCDNEQLSLLGNQLLPGTPPVIANITMEIDAAMLASLIDQVMWDVYDIFEGTFFQTGFQLPAWLEPASWEDVKDQLESLKNVTVKEVIVATTSLGLYGLGPYNETVVLFNISAFVYNSAKRIAQNIDDSSSEFDLAGAMNGLGILEEQRQRIIDKLQTLVALGLWFPESEMFNSLISGVPLSQVLEKMCKDGVDKILFHPNLSANDWNDIQKIICVNITELQYDVMPLIDKSELLDGKIFNWMKFVSTLENVVEKLKKVDLTQFSKYLQDNEFVAELKNLTSLQGYARSLLSTLAPFRAWLFSNDEKFYSSVYPEFLIQTITALKPLARPGVQSLYERLVDPQLFEELIREYATVPEEIKKAIDEFILETETQIASVSPDETNDAYQTVMKNTTRKLFIQLRSAIMNVSGSILPADKTISVSALDAFISRVLSNLVMNPKEIINSMRSPVCQRILSSEELSMKLQLFETTVSLTEKHLGQWDRYVDLVCDSRNDNLTHAFKQLLDDYGWKEDLEQINKDDQTEDQALMCDVVLQKLANISEQIKSRIVHYAENETSWKKLTECIAAHAESVSGLQLRGLLAALGDLFNTVSEDGLTEDFVDVLSAVPGASQALQTLGSRVAVFVPFEQILTENYGQTGDFSPEVINVIKKLSVDVNRIYGAEPKDLAKLMSSEKTMKKWLRVTEEKKGPVNNVKRSTEDQPLEELFQAIKSIDPETFAESLLGSVNHTHLLDVIDDLRMNALMSSDWMTSIATDMESAVSSIEKLGSLGAVMDLEKLIAGEVDPVTFLTSSVQLMQTKLWEDFAESLSKITQEALPLVAGSEIGDDIQQVIDGITSIQTAQNIANVDYTIPVTSLISNWTEVERFLVEDLKMDSTVAEALKNSEINLLEILSLKDSTLEEVMCQGSQVERVVILPTDTEVTPETVSNLLCNSTDPQGLAGTFLQYLDIGPLIATVAKFGLNSTLTSHGMTLEEVLKAARTMVEASKELPALGDRLQSLEHLMHFMKGDNTPEEMSSLTLLRDVSNPTFLKRAGEVMCGYPLKLIPDSLGILAEDSKSNTSSSADSITDAIGDSSANVCDILLEEIQGLAGGNVIMHYIKPLLIGKIFYTPDNAITRQIIAQANETFQVVERNYVALKQLRSTVNELAGTSTEDKDIQKLMEVFEIPWVKGMMMQILPKEMETILTKDFQDASPDLNSVTKLAKEFSDIISLGLDIMPCMELERFSPVSTKAKMEEVAEIAVKTKEFLAGIVFENVGSTGDTETTVPQKITYSIRVDYEKTPSTFTLGPRFWFPGPYSNMAVHMRYHQGFLLLQELIDRAILKLQYKIKNPSRRKRASSFESSSSWASGEKYFLTNHKIQKRDLENHFEHLDGSPVHIGREFSSDIERMKRSTTDDLTTREKNLLLDMPVHSKQQPYPCYVKDRFLGMLNESPVLSLIFSFVSFVVLIVFLIRELVQEKQSRNKQIQEVMGLRIWMDHLVWFFYSLVVLIITVLIMGLIIVFGDIQPKVDFGVLFLFLLCYGLSIISLCYLIASFVPSVVLAVFVGVITILVFNVPFITITVLQAKIPTAAIIISCLMPPSAFGFGIRIIGQYELLEEGSNFSNLWTSPIRDSDTTLGMMMVMMAVDAVLFLLIALIIALLKNGTFQRISTTRRPDLIPPQVFSGQATLKRPTDFSFNIFQEDTVHTLDMDPGLKQSLKKGLSIVGLRRIYESRGKSKVAVDNLNLELYEGQILALLGHNGAGKTTTIAMLTKELMPTAGEIEVYGHDTRRSWNQARKLIGLCPQESILFPLMTVEETLRYYTILKGMPSKTANGEVNRVMVDMGLYEYRKYISRHLSEGLRRRLCMAMAFSGGSKLIILDEPTSGIDPAARTAMWEIISNNRVGRTILLTTHHLDEAEVLADRVAVLHQGRLLCIGSPLALKSEYGTGYTLTLSNRPVYTEQPQPKKDPEVIEKPGTRGPNGFSSVMDITFRVPQEKTVLELLRKYIPNVRYLDTVNSEVTFALPFVDTDGSTNRLPEMFIELESRLQELGFESLEIRPTNLEDVVLSLHTLNSIEANSLSPSRATLVSASEKEEEAEALKEGFDFKPHDPVRGIWLKLQKLRSLLLKRLLHHGRDWVFYIQMFVLPLLFIVLAMIGSWCRPKFEGTVPLELTPSMYSPPSTSFIRTLDPVYEPLANEFLKIIIGETESEKEWSSCPSNVADSNPGIKDCNITATSEKSQCKCSEGVCSIDVTNQPDVNNWILGTRLQHIQSRFGGLSFGVEDPRMAGDKEAVLVWYDNSGYHALPAYINALSNARLHRLLGDDYQIKTINDPIKFSGYGLGGLSIQQHIADIGIGFLILVSLTMVCTATVGYAIAERVRDERRVLYVSGINSNMYWSANIIWDILVLLINVILAAIVLLIFNQEQFVGRENLAGFSVLSLLYGLSILPLFYLLEKFFASENSAVFTFFCITLGVGFITILILVVCDVYQSVKDTNYDAGSAVFLLNDMGGVIKYLFMIFPSFTFASGVNDMASSYTKTKIMGHFGVDAYVSPFTWDTNGEGGLGVHYVSLALWAILGTVILYVSQPCVKPLSRSSSSSMKIVAGPEEDKDIAAERIKIQCGGASLYNTVLRMVGLGHDFRSPPKMAVGNLYLALKRGECFSLLGLNGAGKTTTFRCLTGDLQPSRGQIIVNGQLLQEALNLPYPIMSYCPQSHALDPNLTLREMITIMALIRGFSRNEIQSVTEKIIKQLHLREEESQYICQLSGGTKRKVSTALSLIGNPMLVLLDEPTTGMDPTSRRLIWRAIQSVTQDGRSVLLTSHSMDEVNELSHRMAIMVNGHFVCMGSPHYLKHKLGNKYTIRLKTNDIEDLVSVIDYLRDQLKEVLLKEQNHLSLVMEVSQNLPLHRIFDTLNSAKSMGVTEYDVSQTTLNEVFRVLTSHQGDGQMPPPPASRDAEDASLPMHLPNLHPIRRRSHSPDKTFQNTNKLFQPTQFLPRDESVDRAEDRASLYDNVEEDKSELYATVGKASSARQASPAIDQVEEFLDSESGSADDSPEEEWTHL